MQWYYLCICSTSRAKQPTGTFKSQKLQKAFQLWTPNNAYAFNSLPASDPTEQPTSLIEIQVQPDHKIMQLWDWFIFNQCIFQRPDYLQKSPFFKKSIKLLSSCPNYGHKCFCWNSESCRYVENPAPRYILTL